MPNLSDYKSQTRYNPRLAAQNAVNQDTAHAQALLANSSAAVRADQARYNDPNYTPVVNTGPNGTSQTEKAFGSITNDPNVLAALKQQASTPSSALLNEANTVYNRQPGQTTVYNPGQNGTIGIAQNIDQGQIALNAYNRLLSSGIDPATAAAKLNSEGYSMGVRSAFTAAQPGVIDISGLKPQTIAGVEETPAMFEQRKAAIAQQNAALEAQNTQKQTQARNKAASNSASTAAGASQQFSSVEDLVDHYRKQGTDEQSIRGLVDQYNQQKAPSPEQQGQAAGIESLIATLTPEQRQYLEPMLRAQMQAINQSNALAGSTFGNDMQVAKDNFDTTNAQLQAAADMNVKLQKDLDEISQQMRDSSLENIAKQQKVNEDRLQWEQTKRERDLKNEERKAVDRKIGEMALIGGFGSYASGQIVDEVRNNFESAISDLSIEFGLQRSESAVRFSAQHNDVMNQYRADSINSLSALTAKLEQIGGQFASNKIAKTNAEKSAWDTFVKTHTENADKASAKLESYTKDIFGIINQERDDKRAQEQLGWQRLDWAVKTYGTFTPKAILDSISKQLPGVDVSGVAQSMTLAQMKQLKAKSGGGGSGGTLSFPPSMLRGAGDIPSYEQFVAAKKAELKANPKLSLNQIQAALSPANLKKEYEATKSATVEDNPTDILRRFELRAAAQNLSQPVYKRTQSILQEAIKSGDYATASGIVDNIGDDIDSTSSLKFQQALSARFDIDRLQGALQEVGTIGPVTGRIKSLNPYDPRVVRVNNLITQTVPNLARGVFNEVGVLTDADVARYTKTLSNPNLTVEEAQNAYKDLLTKINVGMQSQVDVWDAQNKRTAGLKQLLKTSTTNASGVNDPVPSTDTDTEYALSILHSQ